MQLTIAKNIDELNWQVAEWIIGYINEMLEKTDRFTLALSGGSTPKNLYQLLASGEFKNKVHWQKLHIFWGDERCVPFTDDRSNAKMAFDVLLSHVPVPRSQIHVMRTDIDPNASANEYEQILKSYFHEPSGEPRFTNRESIPQSKSSTAVGAVESSLSTFDLVLLGLGDNAHTLSLFPGEAIVHERNCWVKAVFVKEVNMQRITLTAPVVNLSSRVAFLVSGKDKATAVSHVLLNEYNPDLYPAQIIKPVRGDLYWFMDEAAALGMEK
jgi:6-phosphogluconolactonase